MTQLVALTKCPVCLSRFKNPITLVYLSGHICRIDFDICLSRTECGHTFCEECLEWWLSICAGKQEKKHSRWTPEHLNKIFEFGMDPRTTTDALPIVQMLCLRVIPLEGNVSDTTKAALQDLAFVEEEEVLGPTFDCPDCRQTLLTAPIRDFLLEEMLSVIPDDRRIGSRDCDTGTSKGQKEGVRMASGRNMGSMEKADGKGKSKARVVDWTRFFGNGLGHGAEG